MKLNGLVTNIRALGESIAESYVVKKVLRTVTSKFLQITSAIEQFRNLEVMTIEETIGSLKDHEEHMKWQMENNGGRLLLIEDERKKWETSEGQLLLSKEDWMKRSNKGIENSKNQSGGNS